MPPQVIPKLELEKLLAVRVMFNAEHLEVLTTALKTYLNGGTPVPEGDSGVPADVVLIWNDTLDDEPAPDRGGA